MLQSVPNIHRSFALNKQFNSSMLNQKSSMSIYQNKLYLTEHRLLAYLEQFKYVQDGDKVLEIGTGAGIFGEIVKRVAHYECIDIDSATNPHYVADISEWDQVSHLEGRFDSIFCCQVLEHMPYEMSKRALQNLLRLKAKIVVVSIPDNRKAIQLGFRFRRWHFEYIYSVPFTGHEVNLRTNEYHYWEIWRKNSRSIIDDFTSISTDYRLKKRYRFFHRFKQHFFVYKLCE